VGVVLSARKVTRRLVVSGKFFRQKALFGEESETKKKKILVFFYDCVSLSIFGFCRLYFHSRKPQSR